MKTIIEIWSIAKEIKKALRDGDISRLEAEQVLQIILDVIYGKR